MAAVTGHRAQRDEFIAVAAEFCELYENAPQLGGERFMHGLFENLPRLHVAGASLPSPDDADDIPEDDLDVRLTVEERQAVDFPVLELLEQLQWQGVVDRLGDDETGWARLYDDLSDIHAELKEGFELLEAGRPEAEAVFGWRDGFWSHWGYHAASAFRLVHYYVALYG